MSVVVSISGHGQSRIVSSDGTRVVIESDTAAPPGASLSCKVEGTAVPFKVKVSSCRRSEGSTGSAFRIEGRLVDLTREQRATLGSLIQGSS